MWLHELILFHNILSGQRGKEQLEKRHFLSTHPLSLAPTLLIFALVGESELPQNEWPIEQNMVFWGGGLIKGKRDWPQHWGGGAAQLKHTVQFN